MFRTIHFYLAVCFVVPEISAFQWTSSSLEDNAHVHICSGSDLNLMWAFNTSDFENLIDLQWFVQREDQANEIIASFAANHFFTDDHRIQLVPPAGLHIDQVKVTDNSTYSVLVNVRNSSGFSTVNTRSAIVSVLDPPVVPDGLTTLQRPGVLQNKKSGQWFVQLECGRFTSLGQPPVTMHWTTPSGQVYNSSSFDNGTFVFNLSDPVESGQYSCAVDNDTASASCLDMGFTRNALLYVNGDLVRIQVLEAENQQLKETNENQTRRLQELEAKLQELQENSTCESGQQESHNGSDIMQCYVPNPTLDKPRTCMDVGQYSSKNGAVTIYLPDDTPLNVYCDQDTDGGGWTVFQRRMDGSVDFYRNWTEYQKGFGNLCGEFWLGLDNLHTLTSSQDYELRVDLVMWNGTTGNATFSNFSISDSSDNYRLHFDDFIEGNAGDSLSFQQNHQFSTNDADHDNFGWRNCALDYHGAWWYSGCHRSNLNGEYKTNSSAPNYDGISWNTFGDDGQYSMKFTEMKIRPM